MTPEQLKMSIFQAAIQGKLVEQRTEEGTAEELYKQISKVAKKDKNVERVTEEEIPFELPLTWKWCRFGEVVECSMGKTPPRAEPVWWNNDFPWVSISDMTDYGYVKNTKEMVSQRALDEKFGSISRVGTLLMSFKLTVGRTSILGIDAVHNEAIISIYPYVDKENYFRDYLFYILPIITQWGDGKNAIKGKTLNSKSIANLMVPLAPLNEMHRIVAKIEELLPYVDRYATSYKKLEQFNAKFPEDMKKSILQYAIQGELVEQRPEEGTAEELYQQIQEEKQKLIKGGKIKKEKPLPEITEDEIPFDIPESWKWVRVCSVGVTQTGNTPKKSHPEYFGNYIPFLGPGDIQNSNVNYDNQGLSEEGKEYGRVTPADSVLQVCIGGSIGKCALVDREVTFNQQINSIYPLISDRKYIYYVLDSYYFKDYMKKNSGGTATPIINRGLWDAIVIPLPPLEEQHRIVTKIEELLPYCDKLANKK